jgi:hypothetical protein
MAPQDHPREPREGRASVAGIDFGADGAESVAADGAAGSVLGEAASKASDILVLKR